MAGYSRQSAASIVPTAVVRATPLNDEFNTLRDAFVVATGHKHDGTSTEGAYVPLISDTNSRNKVVVDSANNRISLFINVSSAAVEQLRLIDGAILPVTDNDIDLGSSSFEFKDLFIDGTANIDSLVADTAAISGGTINSAVIGGTTPAAGTFTTVSATVSATIPSATISGGTINNTTIGATTPAAGTFTNLTVNTAATIASAAISAGTINNTVIGGTTPQAVTGTTITANTGFVGALTGNVTGNVTASSGTSTFNNATVNGTLSATLTGNVNASSGTSTFNNVTISGTLNMDGATAATITNLSSPVNNSDAATKGYVDTAISNLIDTAPGTLDTLNELAAALGDDPNFATTVTNSIATKLSLSGGTMTGAIAMGTNKITGMGDPTNAQDAATKTYVDTQRDTRLALSGGTMSGAIAMGTNKITGLGDPTSNQDAATKIYVDGILGSATSAAASAAAAATSASNAATSASNASTSATNAASSASAAAASAAAAAASYDSFDDRYLGVKTSDPSLDNDGNALVTGAIYFNSTAGEMRVWTGSAWASTLLTTGAQTFTGVKTFSSNPILDAGTANGVAYLNGSKVLTTGSALTFDGTNFAVGGSASSYAGYGTASVNGTTGGIFDAKVNGVRVGSFFAETGSATIATATNVPLIFNIFNAEQMRLTSTGLGIGTSSPGYKLDVRGSTGLIVGWSDGTTIGGLYSGGGYIGLTNSTAANGFFVNPTGVFCTIATGGAERARIDSSGNLGLGVTPSAWVSNQWSVFEGAYGGALAFYKASNVPVTVLTSNAYNDGGWKYKTTDPALQYEMDGNVGIHKWYTAGSGTAGNAISFTQVMTLDASGNLALGKTSASYRFDLQGAAGENATLAGFFSGGNPTRGLTIGLSAGGGAINDAYVVYNSTVTGGYAGHIWQAGGTERFRIGPAGQIGLSGANYGTSGQVLTSNGSGSAPTWQTAGGGGSPGGSSGQVQFNNSGAFGGSANLFWDNTNARLGIRTSSPTCALEVDAPAAAQGTVLAITNSAQWGWDTYLDFRKPLTNGGAVGLAGRIVSLYESSNNYGFTFNTTSGGTNTERARITSGGDLCIGTTTAYDRVTIQGGRNGVSGGLYVLGTTTDANWGGGIILSSYAGAVYGSFIASTGGLYATGGTTGGVVLSPGATSWASSSDIRLKNVIEPISNALQKVISLESFIFSWKSDESNKRCVGLSAQSVQAVLPEAVVTTRIGADPKNQNEYLAVQYTDVIPLLVAAIKELTAQNDELRQRVAALEAK